MLVSWLLSTYRPKEAANSRLNELNRCKVPITGGAYNMRAFAANFYQKILIVYPGMSIIEVEKGFQEYCIANLQVQDPELMNELIREIASYERNMKNNQRANYVVSRKFSQYEILMYVFEDWVPVTKPPSATTSTRHNRSLSAHTGLVQDQDQSGQPQTSLQTNLVSHSAPVSSYTQPYRPRSSPSTASVAPAAATQRPRGDARSAAADNHEPRVYPLEVNAQGHCAFCNCAPADFNDPIKGHNYQNAPNKCKWCYPAIQRDDQGNELLNSWGKAKRYKEFSFRDLAKLNPADFEHWMTRCQQGGVLKGAEPGLIEFVRNRTADARSRG